MFLNVKSFCFLTILTSLSNYLTSEAKANETNSLELVTRATHLDEVTDLLDLSLESWNISLVPKVEHLTLDESLLEASSIAFSLAQVANRTFLSGLCSEQLETFKRNVLHRSTWAMKALDASASNAAGFIFMHNFWLSSSHACETVNTPLHFTLLNYIERIMQPDLLDNVSPFKFRHNVVVLKPNSPWQVEVVSQIESVLHVGLCLPASCTTNEIQLLMQESMQQTSSLFVSHFYELKPKILYVKDLQLKDEFYHRRSLKIFIGLVFFSSVMMLTAAYFHTKIAVPKDKPSKTVSFTNGSARNHIEQVRNTPLEDFQKVKSYIRCFHLSTNWQKLYATKPLYYGDIPVINGLRSMSAFIILSLHVVYFMMHKIDNSPFLLEFAETFPIPVFNAPIYLVDCFFTISGFLVAYNFLKNTKQMETIQQNHLGQNMKKFLKLLFHRYLRLAPLYFVVIAVTDLLVAYLNDVSVFHVNDRFHETCPRNWWHNVLFIQSFFGIKELCASWTWSLSCEMLYFVVATQLLFVYTKHPKLIKNVVIALLLVNIVGSLLIGVSVRYQFSFEAFYLTAGATYINPFVRALPYIVGSIAAWYFVENKCKLNISPFAEKFLWKFSAFLLATVTYTAYWRDLGYLCSMSLFMLGHSMVAVAICWLILASATGRSTAWSRFLEAPVFQHVNRLTYAIYLLNPVIINLIASLNESSAHMNISMLIIYCMGFSVLVYLVSIVFSLAFEMPYCNWSSLIQSRNKTKSA